MALPIFLYTKGYSIIKCKIHISKEQKFLSQFESSVSETGPTKTIEDQNIIICERCIQQKKNVKTFEVSKSIIHPQIKISRMKYQHCIIVLYMSLKMINLLH